MNLKIKFLYKILEITFIKIIFNSKICLNVIIIIYQNGAVIFTIEWAFYFLLASYSVTILTGPTQNLSLIVFNSFL